MLMHDMTSEIKYALAQRGEAKSIDTSKFILSKDSIDAWYEYHV